MEITNLYSYWNVVLHNLNVYNWNYDGDLVAPKHIYSSCYLKILQKRVSRQTFLHFHPNLRLTRRNSIYDRNVLLIHPQDNKTFAFVALIKGDRYALSFERGIKIGSLPTS